MSNSDIEKCILMAASDEKFILGISLNVLLKDSCKGIFILEILSYTYFTFLTVTPYVKEERIFYGFLLGKGFREKCKHTELALNFVQKQ